METNIIIEGKENQLAEFSIIYSKIHLIRGQKVMLDFDLAQKYGIETAQLKRQVRRNIERFDGEDFMFELTPEEASRCQFGILNKGRGKNIKYMPFAFTELGIAMLSSVLNSETAIGVNRKIMRAFVAIRQYVLDFADVKQELEQFMKETNNKFNKNDKKFEAIFKLLDEFINEKKEQKNRTPIGFKTQLKIEN